MAKKSPHTLRILLLEDDHRDAELMIGELEEGGYSCQWDRVETREEFIARLDAGNYDVILADYNLPTLDGMLAIKLCRERGLETPFILVSGAIGEEKAIECLKNGATDYVLKDHLTRLVPVLKRARQENEERRRARQSEQALRESEEKYRELVENAKSVILRFDVTGNVIFINEYGETLFGYKQEELIGRNVVGTIVPEKDEAGRDLDAMIKGICEDPEKYRKNENENMTRDGQKLWINWTNTTIYDPQGNVTEVLCVGNDVTERKRAEEALERSEAEAKMLARESSVIAEIGRIIGSTLNIEEVYGRFAEEVKKLIPFDRIAINVIDYQDQTITIAYIAGHEILGRGKGDRFPLAGSVSEALLRTRTSLVMQTEEEREWEKRLPALLSIFRSGIRSMMSVPLFSKDEVIGALHLESLKPHVYTEADQRLTERVSNQIAGAIANAQLFAKHERSEIEKLTLQEQLRQSQKMEAIGRLAGGIAHDFNNLLTVINGQCQISLLGLRRDDPLRDNLADIEKAAERAAHLTRQLLAFSRRQILKMKSVNLNMIVRGLKNMLSRMIGEEIELKVVLADDLWMVKVDTEQIEQVIMNLVVNAKDAMPRGGNLTIETANIELGEEYASSPLGMRPGAYVMMVVSDTGAGMTKDILEQVFDPFFTTKEKGKGTGLGLSMVYGIVKQSGGDILVDSEVGKGTTFKIYLPRTLETPDEGEVAGDALPQSSETILVVEDEVAIRSLAVEVLKKQGYTVLEASGGGEALLIFEQEKQPIHLILTEVVMPKMNGSQLIERLRQIREDFKVLYISGYTEEMIVQYGVLEKGINLIQKPFTFENLAQKVREVLNKKTNHVF